MNESKEAIARDVTLIGQISAIPSILRVICKNTGLGFAAVARVTDNSWTACAVEDNIQFGLMPGGQLDVGTTLCSESRALRQPIMVDHASIDPVYKHHHTPRIYNIESYISVPIVLPSGEYFGNLCAIDPRPALVSDARTLTMFTLFSELIALQIESEARQHATEAALLDERATAELREQFIAVLGHDLRNPLAAVGATADLLVRRDADPELIKIGGRLRAATHRMSRLIEDVLDFARGRLGAGMGVSLARVDDLPDAMLEVISELRSTNPDRVVIDTIGPCGPVFCDRTRLQQLLSNLLANALTHGAADRPAMVDIRVDDGSLCVTVRNEGVPISSGDLPNVFQPYWRPSSSQPGGGLGLGLYICAQIVAAHGGTLGVNSSVETGTCFTARIPADLPS